MLPAFLSAKKFDWVLFFCTILLVFFGLAVVYSVTLSQETPQWTNLIKQSIALGLGLLLFLVLARIDYKLLKVYSKWLYVFGLTILAAVLILGSTVRGTRGWFVFGGVNFQPVELLKIIVIISLASYFSRLTRPLNQWRYFIVSGLIVLAPVALTMLQPDFGSALILLFLWLGTWLVIGLKKSQAVVLVLGGLTIFFLAWNFFFLPYQKDRISTFLSPASDPLGSGYNVTQAIIAIGSGGWIGRGLSFGSQSQLKFLPEAQTDFVFAVIAEELGLLGVLLVLGLFALIFYRLYKLTKICRDDFSLFLIIGIMLLFFCQLLLNVGMNLGLLPVTGITLPLVSYGGSSLMVFLLALGLAESVRARN